MTSSETIHYARETDLAVDAYRRVLASSGLSRIRPVDDDERLAAMIAGTGLMMTARRGGPRGELVGLARCLTDHRWICYLSDLAVDESAQGLGIGRGLIAATQRELGPGVSIVLVSVPEAEAFYERIGMIRVTNAFKIDRDG